MCFALSLPPEEAGEFLTKGIAEPFFQINDYMEIIFLYGLEHRLSYEECLQMISVFEDNLEQDMVISHTRTTKELQASFELNKALQKDEFLIWMAERTDWFKGYSKTALNYLLTFKKSIMNGIREEAGERLQTLLAETNYEKWCKIHVRNENERESIKRFLRAKHHKKKTTQFSEDMENVILELSHIAYDTREANSHMLSEVYGKMGKIDTIPRAFHRLTGKYLSDLFHIPEKKEQAIRTGQILRFLERQLPEEICPEWIRALGVEYMHGNGDFSTVRQAQKSFMNFQKEQKRRCLLLQRSDLLPLILHVAQKQYITEHGEDYCMEEAQMKFRNLADDTMNACNMAVISEEYQLDMALLLCFQENEMFSYAELLDALSDR
jgi:hypothetical protein